MPTLSPKTTPFYGGGQVLNPANVKKTSGAPSSHITDDNLGTLAVDNSAGNIYGLASKSGGVDTWVLLGGSSGAISSVLGTANQVTVNTAANVATVSLPAAITAPGSLTTTTTLAATTTVTAGTGITATTGNIAASAGNVSASGTVTGGTGVTATTGNVTATSGNFVSSAAGNGIVLNSGTASGTTTATLNGRSGQVTITTPTINAGATFSFALTNSSVTGSTTQVLYGLTGGTTGSAITIQSVTNSANTSTVVVQNASAVTNSTGSLVLTFLVLN